MSGLLTKCRNTQEENGEVGVNSVRTKKYLGEPEAERQGSCPKRAGLANTLTSDL